LNTCGDARQSIESMIKLQSFRDGSRIGSLRTPQFAHTSRHSLATHPLTLIPTDSGFALPDKGLLLHDPTNQSKIQPVRLVVFYSTPPFQSYYPFASPPVSQCVESSDSSYTTPPSTRRRKYVRVCHYCSTEDKMLAGSSHAGPGADCFSARRMGWSVTCSRRTQ
jgi:hypothetical protein